ncbi:GmrSD restriction endonuclease domain-containing protein [Laspinema olomoucense]|uniref:GmrSD restriction endonuclease domain-containing protein n=1 Tax=Laspinema olomoucense TaxID=3231600 RepID=UPI0021BA8E59|nr:DUF262 domain-containing protein [Laspinema sp. D3c]MCT7997346.1 DUF262 domain-containing protein [Laspinema sp. D3c]
MKASEIKLLDFIQNSRQFVIPIYQRTYSWTEKECRELWNDILHTGSKNEITSHFFGSIVYIEKGIYQVSSQSPLLVIDGQQRLTTVTLLIAALANALGDAEPVEGFSEIKLRHYYLIKPLEREEKYYRLILSQTDKSSLIAILNKSPQPKDPSIRITQNFKLFESLIKEHQDNLATVCKGLAKLLVVDVALSREQDNPQLIFESMNSTGRELTQADLIRNYILMGLEPELQTKLYEQYWRLMEVEFGQEAYGEQFDSFMRHFLTVKTGSIPTKSAVYEEFKKYSKSLQVNQAGVEALVNDIHAFARYYCAMALDQEPNPELKVAFQDLRELKVDVAYPFLLELYQDYASGEFSETDFVQAVRLVESYVFRRAVCGIPTSSLNKTFANFTKAFKKDRYLESIQAHFLLLPSYRRFPNDDEFKRSLQTKDLYKGRGSYWLRRLENHKRKEKVDVNDYTIEHVMPQNENLSSAWKTSLGPDWQRIQKMYLHTLGNLTLTAYNSEYSDKPFLEKRDMKNGLKNSPLKLNEGLGQIEQWDENAILQRAERLSTMALDVWSSPKLESDVLNCYQSKPQQSGYTIQDHPHLCSGKMVELFKVFRKEVLALDPGVMEEFLKLYVAYKLESNFVDVVPQAKRLRIYLNMRFPEINDPKGICRDVSGLKHWGNGNVELGLASLEELPYVLGLVRQSLERQMGDVE